jgi:acyl carrier protein
MQNLVEVLAGVFQMDPNQITDATTMEDVERWDSLTHMKLIVTIEQAYRIQLSAEQIMAMKNVKAIKEIVLEKAAA